MVIFVALVCLLAHHALAITELTDANFYDYAKEKDVLLVNFYAPWCGDCKNLAPDLETAASTLGTRGLDLAKVDCFGAGKGLCDTYGIKRWPTLKNFNRGSYTGDYNGGLTSNEIAGYIATVENSIAPANPYAMAIPPPVTQACMAKCHIAKITNKQPCYSKCKTKNFATHNGVRKLAPVKFSPPKPIINEHSCAKCRIPQPPGKLSHRCPVSVRKACISKLPVAMSAKLQLTVQPNAAPLTGITVPQPVAGVKNATVKKAAIQTLTAASNDNVVKLSLKEPLIVPPNAENKKTSVESSSGKSKSSSSASETTDTKGTAFDSAPTVEGGDAKAVKTVDETDKTTDLSTKETLKLINDADDKKTPVLNIPTTQNDKIHGPVPQITIKIPSHDAGDKKMGMQRASSGKGEKQVKYPLPKVPMKSIKANEKHPTGKFAPKFMTLKVPPHDSGDKKTDLQTTAAANDNTVKYPSPKVPSQQVYVSSTKDIGQTVLVAKNLKSTDVSPKILSKLPQSRTGMKILPNSKKAFLQQSKNSKLANLAPRVPLVRPFKQPLIKKAAVKKLLPNSKVVQLSPKLSLKTANIVDKKAALKKMGAKKIESMSPREALKMPYEANDKKRTID